jgi:hypothetical protein
MASKRRHVIYLECSRDMQKEMRKAGCASLSRPTCYVLRRKDGVEGLTKNFLRKFKMLVFHPERSGGVQAELGRKMAFPSWGLGMRA